MIAAEGELKKRNLSVANLENLKRQNESKAKEETEKAEAPLEIFWKALAFFIPGLIPLAFSGSLKADGFHRKAKELARWTVYGFAFYLGTILVIQMLDR